MSFNNMLVVVLVADIVTLRPDDIGTGGPLLTWSSNQEEENCMESNIDKSYNLWLKDTPVE